MKGSNPIVCFCVVFVIKSGFVSCQETMTYVDVMKKAQNVMEESKLYSKISQGNLKPQSKYVMKVASELEEHFQQMFLSPDLLKHRLREHEYSELMGYPEQYAAEFNVSQKCLGQLSYLASSLSSGSTWALEMLDSDSKPSPGILQGVTNWVGYYDECVAISVQEATDNGTHFNGKYCYANVGSTAKGTPPINLGLGVCFPDGCSPLDIGLVMNAAIYRISPNISFTTKYVQCQETDNDLSGRAIASIVLLSLYGILLLAGTAYDVILKQLPMFPTINEKTPLLLEHQHADNSVEVVKREPGRLGNILLSFSIYTNGKKLLSTEQGSGSLRAIHGIRFLSMTWIILGHTIAFVVAITGNPLGVYSWAKRWTFQPIINGTLSVDSFFALSGLLLTYLTLNELQKKKGKLNWFMFYFHRYWRLTPPLALLMLLYIPLVQYWSDGPFWSDQGFEKNYCKDTWWRNLLYIQNLWPGDKMCMGWTWYLANDMQFFIISPLIIIPLFMFPMIGCLVFCVFLLATTIATGVISRVNDFGPQDAGLGGADAFSLMYIKPWCRLGAYLIGMLTGFILHKTKSTCHMKWFVNLPCWALATAIALAVIYGLLGVQRGTVLSFDVAALYNALNRIAWSASLCWLIFACCTGNGGFINTILSWEALIPLSRMTYMAYLVHPIIMFFVYNSRRTLYYATDIQYIFTFLGFTFGTYLVAFVLTLAFESPMIGLERVLLKREKRN